MSVKQVILIRRDLGMRRGKEIAQGSHASMGFLIEPLRERLAEKPRGLDVAEKRAALDTAALSVPLTPAMQEWIALGMAKVCLQVKSEEELLAHHDRAKAAGLPVFLVRDSGRTEFHGQPTYTACAIGPAPAEAIDAVTGDLSLY